MQYCWFEYNAGLYRNTFLIEIDVTPSVEVATKSYTLFFSFFITADHVMNIFRCVDPIKIKRILHNLTDVTVILKYASKTRGRQTVPAPSG